MAIEKPLYSVEGPEPEKLYEFEVDPGTSSELMELPIIEEPPDHDANLVEYLSDDDLALISMDLMKAYEADVRSRADWLKSYTEGLTFLGFSPDDIPDVTPPFEGASNVFHPVLAEAVIRFQSNAISEIFPASGPVLTNVLGEETDPKMRQASRVKEELNYQLTENMSEYRNETEQLLFRLPLAGSVFRKVYFDEANQRPCAMMVTAEDIVLDYQCSDPEKAERLCHVMRRSENDVRKLMRDGFFRSIPLPAAMLDYDSEGREKEQDLTGIAPQEDNYNYRTLLEFHCNYHLPDPFSDPHGIADPYVITIDKDTEKILSIRRNWEEGDPYKRAKQKFIHYQYMPGLGAYGIGLIHLLGSISKAATSILRQLIDAGTFSNLPAGLKTRGLRVYGEDQPLAPGEFRDVETGGGSIRDNIFPLPYKEPSVVLAGLLDSLVEEGRRIGSIADVDISGSRENAPVGTTLALLERSLKVMTAVHARLHASLRRELKLISRVVHDFMPPQYEWDLEARFNRKEDFDGRVDVVPVSDPNAATQAQRVVQLQAIHQMAQTAPDIYDLKAFHREALQVFGYKNIDRIVPPDEEPPYLDPVQENMRVLTLQPIKVYPEQDHQAHIQTHMAAVTDPQIMEMVGQSPNAVKMQGQMEAHVAEHLAFQYRNDMERELGVQLPPVGESLPPELEARLSRLIAMASEQLKERHKSEAARRQEEEAAKDPLFRLREAEVMGKIEAARSKAVLDRDKIVVDIVKALDKAMLDRERILSEEARAGMKTGADLVTFGQELESQERREGIKLGKEITENIRSDEAEMEKLRQEKELKEKEINQRMKKGDSGESA